MYLLRKRMLKLSIVVREMARARICSSTLVAVILVPGGIKKSFSGYTI
jgi:hypothetical protein